MPETAQQIIQRAYREQPQLKRLAVSVSGDAIGSWSEEKGRFVMIAGKAIPTGEFISMPYELLINGQPPVKEWKEVRRELTPEDLALLRHFISPQQFTVLQGCLRGEEKQFFISKLAELAALITTMPKTYEQDGKGDEAIVYLHYFAGGQGNWYITEKDAETEDEPGQHQAFGLADLFGDGGELGYISIVELIRNGAEIDLHFTPRTLREVRAKRAS